MPRHFNTAGPNDPDDHYTVDPAPRLADARELIEQKGYFVVHAPRQTGKTTTLHALAKVLTAEGRHAALHFTCEAASVAGDDYGAATRAILYAVRAAAAIDLPVELQPPPFPEAPDEQLLVAALRAWTRVCPRPLVLFFDEIDSLQGNSLISVLRQLRAGFPQRPADFPWSVVLCGMRDVRDYKLAAGGNPPRVGSSSPFNIKVKSSRLGDFSLGEVRDLYGQHTAETGQIFTEEAISRAFELSAAALAGQRAGARDRGRDEGTSTGNTASAAGASICWCAGLTASPTGATRCSGAPSRSRCGGRRRVTLCRRAWSSSTAISRTSACGAAPS